jgi:hypothetical protein
MVCRSISRVVLQRGDLTAGTSFRYEQKSKSCTNASEAYEHFLVPHIFRPWAEAVIGHAGDLSGQRILDVSPTPWVDGSAR